MTERKNKSLAIALGGACLASALYMAGPNLWNEPVPLYRSSSDPVFERGLQKVMKHGRSGDWQKARVFLSEYSKSSNPQAKLQLAILNLKGWGTKRDLETARQLLLQAVQYDFPGRAQAAFELGRVYRLSKGSDCPRIAFEWFAKSLKWGYAKAHNELGKSYARGLGVQADYDAAIRHYGHAVENGSVSAIAPLFETALLQQKNGNADATRGAMLANKYLPLLEASATNGNRVAARTLARIHSRGLFVKPQKEQAMRWFALAASQGDAVAMHDLAILNMSVNNSQVALKESVAFLIDSAELGYPAAMTALGRIYVKERGLKDVARAISYFSRGAKSGHAGSMAELAKLHFEGKLVPKNLKKAKIFAEQGALQKHLGCKKLLLKIARYEKEQRAIDTTQQESREG